MSENTLLLWMRHDGAAETTQERTTIMLIKSPKNNVLRISPTPPKSADWLGSKDCESSYGYYEDDD